MQRVSDHRLIHTGYFYYLSRLYDETGQAEKVITRYRKFPEIWHYADPNLPEPADARERLKHLGGHYYKH